MEFVHPIFILARVAYFLFSKENKSGVRLRRISGSSSFGRAKAFQALGGEFEPRLPLNSADVAQW